MFRKKLQLKDFKTKNLSLNNNQLNTTKGAYRYIPSGLGSFGQLSWSEIDVRSNRIQNLIQNRDIIESATYSKNTSFSRGKLF